MRASDVGRPLISGVCVRLQSFRLHLVTCVFEGISTACTVMCFSLHASIIRAMGARGVRSRLQKNAKYKRTCSGWTLRSRGSG